MTDQNFVNSEQSGGQKTSKGTSAQFTQQIAMADVDMRTGNVVRKSTPPDDGQELEKELLLSGLPIERLGNDHLKINLSSNNLFDLNSALIKDNARPALEKLADVLRKHNDLPIQIVGHADASGPAEFNLYLADLRVKAVAGYLASLGLSDPGIRSAARGNRDTGLEQSSDNNPGSKRRLEIHLRPAREK
jgi:outer membrane protein OmpA-like peptidoglycan-associated protein